jgi:type IV pilus assembly protein PilA
VALALPWEGTRPVGLLAGSIPLNGDNPMRRSRHAGFTLIELLIVVVIIGILASIAIPKFSNTKGKAYAATMRTDLRNLATAEEGYYFSHETYSDDLTELDFNPSSGVEVTFGVATASGWSAKTTHTLASPTSCAMFVGGVSSLAPAVEAGAIKCE